MSTYFFFDSIIEASIQHMETSFIKHDDKFLLIEIKDPKTKKTKETNQDN